MTLPFDPEKLPRELKQYYISASKEDIEIMLESIRADFLDSLFKSVPLDVLFNLAPNLPDELPYIELQEYLQKISQKNNIRTSFLGDALPVYKVHSVVPFVSSIRNLTTAYTPYQPERSQGTLISLWIYQCLISSLTGFEAINASLYDRATALFEAICCAIRLSKEADTVLVSEGIFPQDMEVIKTLAQNTTIKIKTIPLNVKTGLLSLKQVRLEIKALGGNLAAIVFPHVNQLGLIEDVDKLTDLANEACIKSIAIIDPMLIAQGGLKPPIEYGKYGVDIFVGEGQHLAIGPNFGGPGLGIFGVRFNDNIKTYVRATPGRYVGKAKDLQGRDAFTLVLSTREQHIRKEKATSNICSNQAFLATLTGAALLARGAKGMSKSSTVGHNRAKTFVSQVTRITGIKLAFPVTPFYNECILEIPEFASVAIRKGIQANLHIGVDMSGRNPQHAKNLLKISFSDIQSNEDCKRLIEFFEVTYGSPGVLPFPLPRLSETALRKSKLEIPRLTLKEIKLYYQKLGELNISPDDAPYPLGSCTMKYNPYINDWAAGLPGFTNIHPQVPIEDAQGSLEILFQIQEWFKKITGLAAVATQPVAGAQGELISLKLFQAYHKSIGETKRTKILIPKSAHGTNFASATMSGILPGDIIQLEATDKGHIDLLDLDFKIKQFGSLICGIMITNPNTSGLFESNFKSIAEKIHIAGGLVFMDGANLNAIAGWVDLSRLGVDAVHSNLHKTWSIPHGGGGPGDAIVAVSEKLAKFLPGYQITKNEKGFYEPMKTEQSIGSCHRHWGNFAHKVRCYTYLCRLGNNGIRKMSAVSVLSAQYLFNILKSQTRSLPPLSEDLPRMHEFILTLREDDFSRLESVGITRAQAIPRLGKLFLDFGYYAPTVAFPEPLGFMIEPTESYTKKELDRFAEATIAILKIVREFPEYLNEVPQATPVGRIDEVGANRKLILSEPLITLPPIYKNKVPQEVPISDILQKILMLKKKY